MDNVIQFPDLKKMKKREFRIPTDATLPKELPNRQSHRYLEEISEELAGMLIHHMTEYGYVFNNKKMLYDISFLYENIRSVLFKCNDMKHPIQKLAVEVYELYVEKNEENPQLSFDFNYLED